MWNHGMSLGVRSSRSLEIRLPSRYRYQQQIRRAAWGEIIPGPAPKDNIPHAGAYKHNIIGTGPPFPAFRIPASCSSPAIMGTEEWAELDSARLSKRISLQKNYMYVCVLFFLRKLDLKYLAKV